MRISDWSSDVCSSDLPVADLHHLGLGQDRGLRRDPKLHGGHGRARCAVAAGNRAGTRRWPGDPGGRFHRSEEHTSELQSLMRISYAVFCLKKKTNDSTRNTTSNEHLVTSKTTIRRPHART